MAKKPKKVILRTYQVGFGDCFLLTLHYSPAEEKYILIDFGSTGMPSGAAPDQMMRVANDIRTRCSGELDIVVATHRHKDHISGFTTKSDGTGTGDVIRACNPKVIIQPWTEDPALDAKATSGINKPAGSAAGSTQNFQASSVLGLRTMGVTAINMLNEIDHFSDKAKFTSTMKGATGDQIRFLADDASLFAVTPKKKGGSKSKSKEKEIANASAVDNLNTMSGDRHYVNYGYKLNLASLLPGVKVTVLGPPTIDQYPDAQQQRSKDKDEFWMLYAATTNAGRGFIDGTDSLFPGNTIYNDTVPLHARWFVRNLRAIRGDQLLQIARTMDNAANNTSVILLFEIGDQKLLFPGDAQIENWEYALKVAPDRKNNLKLLKQTTLYKVGHHGSRNATPKSLWDDFANRVASDEAPARTLRSVVSTMAGKHGTTTETAVPRQTLVDALKKGSEYYTTQKLDTAGGAAGADEPKFSDQEIGLWGEIEIDI